MVLFGSIRDYLKVIEAENEIGGRVVYQKVFPACEPTFAATRRPWPKAVADLLESMGISRLFRHQTRAVDRIRDEVHTVVATPTASGKTLIYALPVFEAVVKDPDARALFIYPLKALAQDQCKAVRSMAERLSGADLRVEVYDGDTSAYRRKKIRDRPPQVLMTNPEMLHLSVLPYHDRWRAMLSRLRFVIVDEVHTYRGILGSHMALVFRRLLRLCAHYGTQPTFVFTSATVSNPGQLAEQLTGLPVETVSDNAAGSAARHFVLLDPDDGMLTTTVALLRAALYQGLRTIVYTQSRKLAELLALWAKKRAGAFAPRISAYRAGFLPEERREIETKLASGELLAVVTTSALELGIDIGSLDLCLLVGYPGSIVSTLQRSGRVGRDGRESAVVLIAAEDALDRYFVNHPDQLLSRPPEAAVVNPHNPDILSRHLICAAAELTLTIHDPLLVSKPVKACVDKLTAGGELWLTADGTTYLSPFRRPHRHVSLRGSGSRFAILDTFSHKRMGEVDGYRVFREAHPGAIYLHKGTAFQVETLDLEARSVHVQTARVDYHTRVRSHKETRILSIAHQKPLCGTQVAVGRLRVTEQVTGYDRIQTRTGKVLSRCSLDLPPTVFDTEGLWFVVPAAVIVRAERRHLHVMGGLHAAEHACIGVFPLLVMADRNDLGGIATPFHPQLDTAAIFVYDGLPGGAGLCRQAYSRGQELLNTTLAVISGCPCESGCPSCIHSPKCGSGNRPVDKAAARYLLQAMMAENANKTVVSLPAKPALRPDPSLEKKAPRRSKTNRHYGVLDIETQLSAKEVGGWHRAERMRVSCAVLYDSSADAFFDFVEGQLATLFDHLEQLDLVIGFNIKRFDYRVLGAYTDLDFKRIPTLDLLEQVQKQLGYRLSLEHLALTTLGTPKSADGLAALRWWKEGKMGQILDYCRSDVALTRDLYLFGREHRYLLFRNKAKQMVRLPVHW